MKGGRSIRNFKNSTLLHSVGCLPFLGGRDDETNEQFKLLRLPLPRNDGKGDGMYEQKVVEVRTYRGVPHGVSAVRLTTESPA